MPRHRQHILSLKIRTDNFRPALGNKSAAGLPVVKPIVRRMVYPVDKQVEESRYSA